MKAKQSDWALKIQLKRSTAIEMHKRGKSLRDIMRKLEYTSVSPVQNLLKNLLKPIKK